MRQLFTSIPFIRTLHEPHSPSPQPSLAPVNSRSCRKTSERRSMGCVGTVAGSPLTVRAISHLEQGDEFIESLAWRERFEATPSRRARRKYLQEAGEWKKRECPRHLQRR